MKNPFKTPNNQNSIITGIDMMGDNTYNWRFLRDL